MTAYDSDIFIFTKQIDDQLLLLQNQSWTQIGQILQMNRLAKYKLNFTPTTETVTKFKELRKKHLNWLLTSGDFHDPSYLEIEKNRLRLSIKLDDVESFQNILSNTNLSIDSKISESVIENFFFIPHEIPLINYVIEYNSINIFKFLIMSRKINKKKISIGLNIFVLRTKITKRLYIK